MSALWTPGLGKTTLASIIAKQVGVNIQLPADLPWNSRDFLEDPVPKNEAGKIRHHHPARCDRTHCCKRDLPLPHPPLSERARNSPFFAAFPAWQMPADTSRYAKSRWCAKLPFIHLRPTGFIQPSCATWAKENEGAARRTARHQMLRGHPSNGLRKALRTCHFRVVDRQLWLINPTTSRSSASLPTTPPPPSRASRISTNLFLHLLFLPADIKALCTLLIINTHHRLTHNTSIHNLPALRRGACKFKNSKIPKR